MAPKSSSATPPCRKPSTRKRRPPASMSPDAPTAPPANNDRPSQPFKPAPRDEVLSDRIVTILVGQQKKKWLIHENLLSAKSEFFRASFRGGFHEGESSVLELPEDDPRVFELFIGWAYAQPINNLNASPMKIFSQPDDKKTTVRDYLNLYLFADKYMMEELQNETIDVVYDHYKLSCNEPHSKDIELVYNNTTAGSKMRELMIVHSAFRLFSGSVVVRYWGDVLKSNSEIGHDLILMIGNWRLKFGQKIDKTLQPVCHFHVHKKTGHCTSIKKE